LVSWNESILIIKVTKHSYKASGGQEKQFMEVKGGMQGKG